MKEKAEIKENLSRLFYELKSGKFIMSESRISVLLKYIASEELLLDVIASCNTDFYFDSEFERCADMTGSVSVFKMPQKPEKIVALVTGLLYKFDRRKIDFHRFISEFYASLSANDEFLLFFDAVMVPYEKAFFALVDGIDESLQVIEDEELPLPLEETAKNQIMPIIAAVTENILEGKLPAAKTKECVAVLEGFYYALEDSDERIVRAMWIGVKNTLKDIKFIQPYLKSIEDLIKIYVTDFS